MSSLDLALVGNCTLGALVDERAEVVWGCLPRFDGDPFFCSLLRERHGDGDIGFFAIDVLDFARSEQQYLENTAILVTRLYDQQGGCVEVTDFVPRFPQYGRIFRPMMLVRKLKRLAGSPRITLRLRPAFGYGDQRPAVTWGSNHVRYVTPGLVVRLTTDASITAVLQETTFFLEDGLTFLFGPDETVPDAVDKLGQHFLDETAHYWRQWVSTLGIPFEWQDAVIRAAITLKLNTYEDTGAIIAAMTTSIPEAPNSTRNWDYRYCWLRDGYFVVNALNRLGGTHSMEHYIAYIVNVAAAATNGLQPVYGIDGRAHLEEQKVPHLPGYRDMGPVRIGNDAYRQVQHDVYGSVVLAAMHLFFDRRLTRQGDATLFHQLEPLGERAVMVYNQPDAGIWEFRGSSRIHTHSAVMCWVACDRLAKVAIHLELHNRGEYWRGQADRLREEILRRAWSEKLGCFSASLDGEAIDASLLLLVEMNFVEADDPRFTATVAVIEKELRHGDFIFRYVDKDDFGTPETAFLVCTFWYINALAAIGRRDEARELFTKVLGYRNRHGLLAEDVDIHSGEQWGNFVQTYSMAGLINAAIRLSIRWDQAF